LHDWTKTDEFARVDIDGLDEDGMDIDRPDSGGPEVTTSGIYKYTTTHQEMR